MEKHPVHPYVPPTPPGQDSFPSQGNFRAFSCYCPIHEALTSLVATPWGLMFRVERDRSPSICHFLQRSGGGKRGRLCMFTASSGTNAGDRLARRLGHFPLKVTQITSIFSFFLLPVFFLLLPPSPPIALSAIRFLAVYPGMAGSLWFASFLGNRGQGRWLTHCPHLSLLSRLLLWLAQPSMQP